MPALIPAIVGIAATKAATFLPAAIGTAVSWIGLGVSVIAPAMMADAAARRQRRAQRAAAAAAVRDGQVMIRSAEAPRTICYGEVRTSGVVVYARSTGPLQDTLLLVVALSPGHEISEILGLTFGQRPIGPRDASGWATAAPWARTHEHHHTHHAAASGGATTEVTLPHVPVGGSLSAWVRQEMGGWGGQITSPLQVLSVSGQVVTLETSGRWAGQPLHLTYRWHSLESWLRVVTYLGTEGQVADPSVISDSGGQWTTAHRGRGVPYLALWLRFNQDLYPHGVEDIRALIRGRRVFDPRSGLTVWSRNPALCVRDWLTAPFGFGAASSEIDDATVIAAANACDEQVTVTVGGSPVTQPRYRCDALLSSEMTREQCLQTLLDAMAGWAVWSQGRWRVHAGVYSAPVWTLDESALSDAGQISVQARVPRRELANAVRGTYISPLHDWQPTDYPAIVDAVYQTQDGGQRLELELPLMATSDPVAAQRLARVELEEARQSLTLVCTCNMRAYAVQPGDVIAVTLARYGWVAKPFRVLDREYSLTGGVRLTLRETGPSVYEWTGAASAVDPLPNTQLPSGLVAPPIGALTLASGTAHLLRQADGTIQTRLHVSWPAVVAVGLGDGVQIEVEWTDAAVPDVWHSLPREPAESTQVYVAPVQDGEWYQVRVRSRTDLGVRSAWSTSAWHQALGKTEPPPAVTGLHQAAGVAGLVVAWDRPVAADLAATELRVGASWSGGSPLARVVGESHVWDWLPIGTHTLRARHVDTSGNFSTADAVLSVTVTAPPAPALASQLIGSTIVLTWVQPASVQPIRRYLLREGPTWASAVPLGVVAGDARIETLHAHSAGTRVLWLAPEDAGGNLGVAAQISVVVGSVVGFAQRFRRESDLSGTRASVALECGRLVAPVDLVETWSGHFTARGWTTIQSKVAAGSPLHVQPTPASGTYEEVADVGSTIPAGATVSVSLSSQWLAGGGTITAQIWVSATSGTGPWTALAAGLSQPAPVSFRWVRAQITVTGDGGGDDVAQIGALTLAVTQQDVSASATITAVAGDTGGTVWVYPISLSLVTSVQATAVGAADRRAVVDWTPGAVSPTQCRVLLFDAAGARVTGTVAMRVDGFV